MKILLLDIETAPNLGYFWSPKVRFISSDKLVSAGYTMCWAAKWYKEEYVHNMNILKSSEEEMLQGVHDLMTEADAIVHYNGRKFDIPILNKEFIKSKILPPSPYKQIDLYQTARNVFKFEYNSLDHVAKELGLDGKIQTKGMELWKECMAMNENSWDEMINYNIGDVLLLEQVYDIMKPWIPNHPNHNLYSNGVHVCPNCGGTHLQKRGTYPLTAGVYQRYRCVDCGKWSRDTNKIKESVKVKGAV